MTPILTAIVATVIAIVIFFGHKQFRKYLDSEWNKNPIVPTPNGNGKSLQLRMVNGIGFTFYGQYREANIGQYYTYATYYMFCFFFVPIISIRCYRVAPSENDGYYVLGSEKTDFRELFCFILYCLRWISIVIAVGAIAAFVIEML